MADRAALHELLEACAAQREWQRALDVLAQLAADEPAAERRARVHYAAAMIARDELDDPARPIGELDAAWCATQVLVVLGAASDDERRFHAERRGAPFTLPARRLTDELWHKQLAHPREDRRIGAIFAAALPALAADTALPARAFGVALDARVDLEREPPPIARMLRQACSVL